MGENVDHGKNSNVAKTGAIMTLGRSLKHVSVNVIDSLGLSLYLPNNF